MQDRSSPREELHRSLLRLEGAYAANTLRAYRAGFTAFLSWCDATALSALPAAPGTVAQFVLADAATAKPATVRRRIAAIGRLHRLNGLADPTKSEEALLAMKRMHRQKGRRQQQALGMTAALCDQLIAVTENTAQGLRDQVLLRLAYDTIRRRTELTTILIEGLHTRPDGSGVVLLRFSKTDQEGEGKKLLISVETMAVCTRWVATLETKQGPILRKVSRYGVIGSQFSSGSIPRIYKRLARKAKLPEEIIAGISGHSFRVGAAQDMLAGGATLAQIMSGVVGESPKP